MKKILYILLATFAVACSNDKESFDISIPDGMGLMRFNVDVLSQVESTTDTRVVSTYNIPAEYIPTNDSLNLKIYQEVYDEDANLVYELYAEYASLTEYNNSVDEDDESVDDDESSDADDNLLTKSPYLPAGDYYALVTNGHDINEESLTNAYFADSTLFTIVARDTERSTSMNIMLQNSIINIEVTDNFLKYYEGGASLKLTTENGAAITLDLPLADDYVQEHLYVQPYTRLYLEGTAVKQGTGTGVTPTVTFTKSEIGIATKSKLNCVVVDAEDAGGATIEVTLNNEITKINELELDLHN